MISQNACIAKLIEKRGIPSTSNTPACTTIIVSPQVEIRGGKHGNVLGGN